MNERHPYSLLGIDGNAFSIMAYTVGAMRDCGYSREAIDNYKKDAMSSDYDHLLCVSIEMVDKCNALGGYDDPGQQLMKGHDDLEYVDGPYGRVTNRREKLVNEQLDLNFQFEDYEEDEKDEEFRISDDYFRIYNSLTNMLVGILNGVIANGNEFSKLNLKNALTQLVYDTEFWDDLEYDVPTTRKELNESYDIVPFLKNHIWQRLINELNNLLEDGVQFSKYDIYHIFLQILDDPHFYSRLYKYIKD